jgi:hypothetical protein
MRLSQENLDECNGWMFSPSLGQMIREHEVGDGTWDIEVDDYQCWRGRWEPSRNSSAMVFRSVGDAIIYCPYLVQTDDWISGDDVEMF